MSYPVVSDLVGDGIPVAVACGVLNVSTSGYYEWRSRPPSSRDLEQAQLMDTIRQVHAASYGTLRPSAGPCRAGAGPASVGEPRSGGAVDALQRPTRRPPPPVTAMHPPR